MTLLERARGFRRRGRPSAPSSKEELELAVAFMNSEVTYGEAAKALQMRGRSGSTAGVHLLSVLRRAVADCRAHVLVLR